MIRHVSFKEWWEKNKNSSDWDITEDEAKMIWDASEINQLLCLFEIRQVVGDPTGKLMQSELVDLIRKTFEENKVLRDHLN